MTSRMPPLAPRVSTALAEHASRNRGPDGTTGAGRMEAGRVAVTTVADWLDELGHRRGSGTWFQRFAAQVACRAVASILRGEVTR